MASILNPPTNVTTKVLGNTVTISWKAVEGTPKYYYIYRGTEQIGEVLGKVLTYTDEDVADGIYVYSVKAAYSEGLSDAAFAKSVTVGDIEQEVDDPSAKNYYIVDGDTGDKVTTYTLAPNETVSFLRDLYFRETVETDDGDYVEEVALSIDVTPEYNDYSNAQNFFYLKNVWKFRGVADAILSIAYDFCEFSLNKDVEGLQITADDTGFKFESKYFLSQDSFVNYQTAIKLYTERFLTLKRQRYLWNYSKLRLNDLSAYTFNFFTFPEKG